MSYEKTVRVVLHGYLKDLYKDEIVLSGHSAAEVLNGMCKMTSAFNPEPLKDRHLVAISGFTTKEEIYGPLPADIKELHISPAMTGGKKGGFFLIVVGVIAIAAAVWTGGASLSIFSAGGLTGFLANTGLSLLLGGVIAMLSPQPKISSSGSDIADPEASKYLGASQNTVKIGTRIPIMYGKNKAYGHYISFNVDAKDVVV